MSKRVKREAPSSRERGRSAAVDGGEAETEPEFRAAKRERVSRAGVESTEVSQHDVTKRRVLRSQYLAVIHEITEGREDLWKVDSNKFSVIINEVEKLHEQVQKPREQVADAEALQDIANTLVTSIRSQSSEGVTPSDFISSLIREFGCSNGALTDLENSQISVDWKCIGLGVSPIFRKGHGCCTMLGPMSTQLKVRKTAVTRKHLKPTENARPEDLGHCKAEGKTDTDKNMSMLFEILRRKKHVRLELLILNRSSFAQTVENLFALSFLVKDGRAEISVDQNGFHFVSPRNAPGANSIMSREVTFNHFVFRFDFKDWKLMMDTVTVGEEMMPHRGCANSLATQQEEAKQPENNSREPLPTTPIRKLSRNRGRVVHEESSIVEDSPDIDSGKRGPPILRRRRSLTQE